MRREGVLFLYKDKPACFWTPEDSDGYAMLGIVMMSRFCSPSCNWEVRMRKRYA
jgi:hypothetical protein